MKNKMIKILFIIGIIATLSVLLYPFVADHVNSRNQSRVVSYYFEDIAEMDDSDRQAMLEAAHEYNINLLYKTNRFVFTDEDTLIYKKQLDAGRGIMGILKIDKINVNLPIYHGTDEGVLQVGAGHLRGTSLPVGGIGTHAFITGHRGLPSSTLLSNLDKMVKGDIFIIYVMGETLTYEVDDIQTVIPEDVDALNIYPDKDYCTLVTCTPYGINTHRLLVRGHRVDGVAESQSEMSGTGSKRPEKIVVIGIFMIPVLPILLIIAIIKCVKIYRKGKYRW